MLESEEQSVVISWAHLNKGKYPCLKWLYHCPNGGSRNVREAARLKRMGVKPGVSDLFLPHSANGYHGLYIEMKVYGNKASKHQRDFMLDMENEGYKAVECVGAGEAINTIKMYLEE